MGTYVIIKERPPCRHFNEGTASEAVGGIYYTDKEGKERHGAHWTLDQIKEATKGMKFAVCVTDWDKYVAFNAAYADFCKVFTAEQVLQAAHAFFFADEDAPEDKVFRYIRAMIS